MRFWRILLLSDILFFNNFVILFEVLVSEGKKGKFWELCRCNVMFCVYIVDVVWGLSFIIWFVFWLLFLISKELVVIEWCLLCCLVRGIWLGVVFKLIVFLKWWKLWFVEGEGGMFWDWLFLVKVLRVLVCESCFCIWDSFECNLLMVVLFLMFWLLVRLRDILVFLMEYKVVLSCVVSSWIFFCCLVFLFVFLCNLDFICFFWVMRDL